MQAQSQGGRAPEGRIRARRASASRLLRLALATSASLLLAMTVVAPAWAQLIAAQTPAPGAGSADATGANGEPLTAADRELLVKVRLAGLWENPAGRMAAKKGASPRVRQIGTMIADQHSQLDRLVVKAAGEVGVPLPDKPNAEQQGWLNEMGAASGAQFDQIYVDRLRAAHGKVFPAIANVRAGTRNTVVRQLAQSANGFVLTHLTLLESTNLVDYSGLPLPPQPSASPTGSGTSSGASSSVGLWLNTASQSGGGLLVPVLLLLGIPILVRRYVLRRFAGSASSRFESRVTDAAPPPYPAYNGNRRLPPSRSGDDGPAYARSYYPEPDGDPPRRRLPERSRPRP